MSAKGNPLHFKGSAFHRIIPKVRFTESFT
jgi:hypothetical protein